MFANHLKIWEKKKCTSVEATTFVELLVKFSHFKLLLNMALNMVSIT